MKANHNNTSASRILLPACVIALSFVLGTAGSAAQTNAKAAATPPVKQKRFATSNEAAAALSDGQLVADKIRFDEQDLRAAQALQVTDQLAQENERRLAASEENARKLAGQIEENTALANAAQARADEAMKNAERANNRINGLDDYDPVRTFTVLFRPGSAVLTPKAKADMDAGAAWVKQQNTKGWVVAVVGFADTTGNTARNRSLSERRANAVIGYLVMKHNLPLQRLIQPFGYGDSNAVADNATADGRAKNRRVEIRLLVNKGIAGTVD